MITEAFSGRKANLDCSEDFVVDENDTDEPFNMAGRIFSYIVYFSFFSHPTQDCEEDEMVKKKKNATTTEGKTANSTPRKRTPKAKSSTEGKEKTTPKPKAAQGGALANKKRKRAATEVEEKQEVEDKEHNGGTKGALEEALPHEDAPKSPDVIKPKAEVEKSTTSEVSNTEIDREDVASDELEAPPKAEPDKKKQKTKRKPKVRVMCYLSPNSSFLF